jgi:glycosyltransferase involved in cell wall biosynthesis
MEKISVVMCTYNGGNYLKEQIDSIIRQTYPIYELIIQDDCSSDETLSILMDYEKKYPFIRVFKNEKQKGINANFFSAMRRATGDYIALSDQDDIWRIDKIERQAPYVKDFWLVAGTSKPFAGDEEAKIRYDERDVNIYLERQIHNNMVSGHTMLFRKALIDKIPDETYWADYFLYDHLIAMVAAAHESIKYIPHVLVDHRRLVNSSTYNEPLNFEKTFCNMLRIISRTFKQYRKLRPEMSVYFSRVESLLEATPVQSKAKSHAVKLARYHQAKNSPGAFLRLAFLCVQLRDKIFYVPEHNRLLAILRAIYYPISSSDYLTYLKP